MRSMTGYGEGSAASAERDVEVSIRTVNHRYLDLAVRLPEALRAEEAEIESRVRRRLLRGRVEIRVEIRRKLEAPVEVTVRRELVAALARELEALGRELPLAGGLRPGDLLRVPGAIEVREPAASWTEADAEALAAALDAALDQVAASRRREGERLREVLEQRHGELEELCRRLERQAAESREGAVAELEARIAELLGEAAVPRERLVAEAAVLVERADVREELDRLASHLASLAEALAAEGAIGRRLDFLAQEILRELNTTAAKARGAEMVATAVEGKLVCEQIREQVQNVE